MTSHHQTLGDPVDIDRRILRDQAAASVRAAGATLPANLLVAVLTVVFLWNDLSLRFLLSWFAAICLVTAARYHAVRRARLSGDVDARPDRVLRVSWIGAMVAGSVWSVLAIVSDHVLGEHPSMLLFILMGLSAGAVALGTAHAQGAIAFAAPILAMTILKRTFIGGLEEFVFAICALFFTLMLARSAQHAQRDFRDASRMKHAATALSEALRIANEDTIAKAAMLEVLARHDTLTGLVNRVAFSAGITACLAAQQGRRGSVLMLDLDHFKLINDTLGHGAGDGVLREVAARLQSVLGDTALASRLGGDEFAVLIDDARPPEEVARLILTVIARPLMIGERAATVGASIGIACFPEDGETAEDLMVRADLALYAAKSGGRQRFCRFDVSLQNAAKVRRDIELDLPKALSDGAIEVWYQPQVALSDHHLVGVESLIRWKHERHGWISPPDIVAAALTTHRSEALTLHVVADACRLIQALNQPGTRPVSVAVNVSPQELGTYPLARRIAEVLAQSGAPARHLEIEITEEAAIAGDAAIREIDAISAHGVRIAIDDFGAGYSSLASLRALRVERIKIDRSFVMDMSNREGDRILVQAILGIGRALGVDVVAEGVERADDAVLLARYGCHVAQGYHFARPMPRADLDAWIRARTVPVPLTVVGALPYDPSRPALLRRSS